MNDEIRQDSSEGQTEAVSEMTHTDGPTAPGEQAGARQLATDAVEETEGPAEREAPSSAEAMSVQAGAGQEDSSEVMAEAAEAGTEGEAVAEAQVEAQPSAEPATGIEAEAVQVEAMSISEGPSETGAAQPAAADTLAAEAEVVQAAAAPMRVEPEAEGVVSEGAPSEAEAEDDRHWYVVHCYSGYENKVRHNLEQRIESMGMKDKIFDVVVPTEEEIEVKEGKRRTVERRVFPGYILVQMIMTEESWYVVRNTPGVTGFVGMGNEPTPLRPEEVAQIIRRMEAEAPRVKVTYKIDQKVRIIDGPFNDFIGTVDDIDMERAKVRVMVSFFGRETPVELDFLQVEKA
jgi:transcriptional antiterminator NusG